MNKKMLLDKIYHDLGKQHTDFQIFNLGKTTASKWKKYSEVSFPLDPWESSFFLDRVNNRTICKNEVVLDIENKNNVHLIKSQLKKISDCDIYCYDTGSKGIHVHLWYKNPVKESIKEKLIKIFDADGLKTTEKPIALENIPHWKTGKRKRELWKLKNL